MEINLEILLKNKASKVKFTEVSKYPSVTRDFAFVVKEEVMVADIISSIKKNSRLKMCIRDRNITDSTAEDGLCERCAKVLKA